MRKQMNTDLVQVMAVGDIFYFFDHDMITGLILGLRSANERRLYKVTPSLIGWKQT